MTDRELLEAAAKAAGIGMHRLIEDEYHVQWNPLVSDGDALRLAVKLGLQLDLRHSTNEVRVFGSERIDQSASSDPYAATRRAIVRAAAEIGRSMM